MCTHRALPAPQGLKHTASCGRKIAGVPGVPARLRGPVLLGNPTVASFAELLIDCEEDWIRAVLVGMLREGDRK